MTQTDSDAYLSKKQYFSRLLTVYGRKTVLEALLESSVSPKKLHLSKNNKSAAILDQIIAEAKGRNAEIVYHDSRALSRISKNAKQDQGVALDLAPEGFAEIGQDTFQGCDKHEEFIALDKITNPQNLGMIVRSVCASKISGLILPRKGCAKLDALVIKASAGTLFRTKILRCDELASALTLARSSGVDVIALRADAEQKLSQLDAGKARIYVLGNETNGLSEDISKLCRLSARIDMMNRVESLNVAVTASLIALHRQC